MMTKGGWLLHLQEQESVVSFSQKQQTRSNPKSVGNQTGGRVFLFLFTDDFWRDYNKMLKKEIRFVRPPKEEPYGVVAVFEDLYGNMWDLLEPSENNKGVVRNY